MEIGAPECSVIDTENEFLALNEFIEEVFVPRFDEGFDRPANKSDYSLYLGSCDLKFEKLFNLVKNRFSTISYDGKLKKSCLSFITSVIIIQGEHSSHEIWTTEITRKLSKEILDEVLVTFKYLSLKDALISNNCIIFDEVLKALRPKLLKNTWKNYGASVICYSFLLSFVESPHLAEYLNSTLPTALILTDDFVLENRILGLKSLEHIINNVGKTHLCLFSQDKVILQALEHLLFYKDENLIKPLISILVALLKKKYPQHGNIVLVIDEFDSIINNILYLMMEQKIKLRNAYSEMLPILIRSRGLGMLLHSVAILKVIDEYVFEPTSSFEGLEILKNFIVVCWPRLNQHFDHIFLIICKIYLGLKFKRYPDVCKNKILEIVFLLQSIFPDKIMERKIYISRQKSLSELEEIFT